MRAFFNVLTQLSLRFRWVTLALVILVIVLGGVAGTELQQELIPPVEFPTTIVFASAPGMTSEQVLSVVTMRLEDEIDKIPEIVNIETQTSGAFGAVITASNDFGLDQEKLQADVLNAIDNVWFPHREISAPAGTDPAAFGQARIAEITPEMLLYFANRDRNLLFQMSTDVWQQLPAETIEAAVIYLASNTSQANTQRNALQQLVEQEIVPQLNEIDLVANVQIAGGQTLPSEEGDAAETEAGDTTSQASQSLLMQLSSDVWAIVNEKLDLGERDDDLIAELQQETLSIPTTPPPLPENWQMDHFNTAEDIREIASFGTSIAGLLNDFIETGHIEGALGKTDDLTPETVRRMLDIEPTLVQYFEAEHLVAMSGDVFAELPDDYIDQLDGFTRDALSASALAQSLTGEEARPEPVTLPDAWRVPPPRLLTFSFADIPLATFSVFTEGTLPTENAMPDDGSVVDNPVTDEAGDDNTDDAATAASTNNDTTDRSDLPEGPTLPLLYGVIGDAFLQTELNTADDLISISVPEEFGELLGEEISAAGFFNFLVQAQGFIGGAAGGEDGAGTPEGAEIPQINLLQAAGALVECGIPLNQASDIGFVIGAAIGCLDADSAAYLIENDPDFVTSLDAAVIENFSDEVLAIEGISPPLADTWNTLSEQPQFADNPLDNADDVLMLGNGQASMVLNTINETVPARFAGYEVRLFDSLTPTTVRYFAANEVDFYTQLDSDVLLKMSPAVLSNIPAEALETFGDETVQQVQAIIAGDEPSAAARLAERYTTDIIPPDPDAPPLNDDWQVIGRFLQVELNNAYDLFRYPDAIGEPAAFINGLFNSANGASFAPALLGNLSLEAFNYIADEDPNFVGDLNAQALNLLPDEIFETLPQSARDRAESGEVFTPTNQITRTNLSPSLLVTVFKDADANTVAAFYAVKEVIDEINANNEAIEVEVAFEQSSFIEESITGVVREGTLGAFFAIINILIFLSGDVWGKRGRQIVGALVFIVAAVVFVLLIALQWEAAGGNFGEAFANADTVLRVLTILGMAAGLAIMFLPGDLPYPAWRSTIVIGVSIPLSILAALALMRWLPELINGLLADAPDTGLTNFILKLAPENLTLNIMTLSGLTVAVGRVVDDSIVVLENIYREIQTGMDKRTAIIGGVRDVSVAIFSATGIAVVVFLPLGLTGGLIGEFFLPFGLAVTYALASSFFVAITVVPALASIFISADNVPKEHGETWMERIYRPVLQFVLRNNITRFGTVLFGILSLAFGGYLFTQRPAAFLPDFGEPQISATVSMPQGTRILETNELVEELENYILSIIPEEARAESTIRTIVGGGGLNFDALLGGGGVSENQADVTINVPSQTLLEDLTPQIREQAEAIFGVDNVTVSAGSIASGGFGGFEMVVKGPNTDVLAQYDADIIRILNDIDGLTNVTSNLSAAAEAGNDGPPTIIRIDGQPAISYTGELETEDSINLAREAIETVQAELDLPDGVSIGQGFDTELQQEGFASVFVAMGLSVVIVVAILVIVFGSPIYWLAVIFSIVVAPVGAAVALTLSDRVLGISALIGLLMLLGLVVTNAVVLIDRVGSNRKERGMPLYDALIEAGTRRLRPILMTSIATIIALIPLSVGLSEGAIIAAELGTVVIGGVFSSTLLTLLVVPVAYYLFTPIHDGFMRLIGRNGNNENAMREKQK